MIDEVKGSRGLRQEEGSALRWTQGFAKKSIHRCAATWKNNGAGSIEDRNSGGRCLNSDKIFALSGRSRGSRHDSLSVESKEARVKAEAIDNVRKEDNLKTTHKRCFLTRAEWK